MSSTREQILEWIGQSIAALKPGDMLPTDKEIAARWNYSQRQVRRILCELRESGKLVRIPGKGTFVPRAEPLPDVLTHAQEQESSPQRLAEALGELVNCGEIRAGEPLPQLKYLARQYRVSESTASAAMRMLSAQNRVIKVGRRYLAGGSLSREEGERPGRSAWMIVDRESDRQGAFLASDIAPALSRFERELHASGYVLRCGTIAEVSAKVPGWSAGNQTPDRLFVYCGENAVAEAVSRIVVPLKCSAAGSSVSVLYVASSNREGIVDSPGTHIVSIGNIRTAQARAVGDFVARYPDRAVMMITRVNAGAIHGKSLLRYAKHINEMTLRMGGHRPLRWVLLRESPDVAESAIRQIVIEEEAAYWAYLQKKYDLPDEKKFVNGLLDIRDGFDGVLEHYPQGALWVCSTADIALDALAFLSSRRVEVPRRIAVLSLQSTPALLPWSCTTCAPDWDQIGYLMAHTLVGDITPRCTGAGYVRMPVQVMQRATT